MDPVSRKINAATVCAFGKPMVVGRTPLPESGDGEIQVKIEQCGVCDAGLHAAEGDWPVQPEPPCITGHPGEGLVPAVGRSVTHVKEGNRIGIPWPYLDCAAIANTAWVARRRCVRAGDQWPPFLPACDVRMEGPLVLDMNA